MPDLNAAVDNLIASGWKDEDIKKQIDNVNEMTDSLINQGKADNEIEAELSKLPMFAGKSRVDFNTTPSQVTTANKTLVPQKESWGDQFIRTLPQALFRALPFPNLFRAINDPQYRTMESFAQPLPEIITDPINKGVEFVRSKDPSLAKDIEAGMAMSPFISGALPKASELASSAKRFVTGENAAIAPLSDVSGRTLTNPLTPADRALIVKSGRISPEQAAVELRTAAVSPENVQGVVGKGQDVLNKTTQAGIISSVNKSQDLIDAAKASRNYAIHTNNSNLFGQSERVLDSFKIPKEERIVTTEIADAQSSAIIESAKKLREVSRQRGDLQTEAIATDLINRNGILTTNDVFNPNKTSDPIINKLKAPEEASTAADLNIVAEAKPAVNFNLLRNSAVKNADGTPKEVYHGTAVNFKNFDIDKSQEGLYGNGIYFTDEPKISTGYTAAKYQTNRKNILDLEREKGIIVQQIINLELDYKTINKFNSKQAALTKELDNINNQIAESKRANPNVRPAYLNIKNPFNIDDYIYEKQLNPELLSLIKERGEYFAKGREHGSIVYRALNDIYSNKGDVNLKLKESGFDGITHIGGQNTGNAPHQVYIAFSPNQVISKFDKRLYKDQLKWMSSEPTIVGKKIDSEKPFSDGTSGLTHEKAVSKFDIADYTGDEYQAGDNLAQIVITKNAGGLKPLTQDVRELIDMPESQRIKLAKEKEQIAQVTANLSPSQAAARAAGINLTGTPPPNTGQGFTGNTGQGFVSNTSPRANLELPLFAIVRPFYRIAAKIEADTGIPVLNEMYYKGRQASNHALEFKLSEMEQVEKIFGEYTKNRQFYIRGRERISDILENIKHYDTVTGNIQYQDSTGRLVVSDIPSAARRNSWNLKEAEIASNLRDFYDSAIAKGAPFDPNAYIDFYNPIKYQNNPGARMTYFNGLRQDEQAFFAHHRSNNPYNQPLIRDSLLLVDKYISEWATVEHLVPWQKDIAEPILNQVYQHQNTSFAVDKPLDYLLSYTKDLMGIPRQGAVNFNETIANLIENHITPRSPRLAENIYAALSRDRSGEVLSSKLLGLQYKGALAYRPLPAIRNFTQRMFADPLVPGGLNGIRKGMSEIKTQAGQDKIITSGILGYLGDMVDKGIVGHGHWTPLRGYQAIENGNRGSIYLAIHDGILKDFRDGITIADVAKKYRLNLYPEVIRNKFKDLYSQGKVGDVRSLGLTDNAAHFLGDWAQLITQFPYDKGGGLELFKQGPIAKQMGAFGSWSFFTTDYMANLLADAYKSPKDLARVVRMIGYFSVLDYAAYQGLGMNLSANPFLNTYQRISEGPTATAIKSLHQAITAKWDAIASKILLGRDDDYKNLMASEGWRKFKQTLPVIIPGGMAMKDAYNFVFPKEKKPVDITP